MIDWKQTFIEAIEQDRVDEMVGALQTQSTSHAGTAPAKVKNDAAKLLRKINSDKRYPLLVELCHHEDPSAQEIGAICLTDFYGSHSEEVNKILYALADSDHWEVREWVASACGLILERNFPDYFAVVTEWSKDASENVRRAAVLSAMYAGKSRNPEFAEALLNLLEPLLSDCSKYVRDNLGPFAIGNALLKYYPTQVLDRIRTWVKSEDEQVRWNVAMIFSAADGAKFAEEAKSVLDILSADERPYVKRAVDKAIKNIQRRAQ